ncbi:MAG: glycosyltransferase family 39 protein [Flavobacteriaceae bacterium]
MNEPKLIPPKFPRLFLYFLGAILILNLIQAQFTELIFDEAYYWYYSKSLSFGYFDHPPMVAWMIYLGGLLFDGELGVRLISCFMSAGTIVILWLLIDRAKKNDFIPHFFVLVFSMTLLNAYGFFTLPDTPLLFFTALFLLVYKKFLDRPTMLKALWMGLAMAALMYSKYHAVLVILFVLLSNPGLLTNKYAWFSVWVAISAYLPHFWWLYDNDFISVKYHLFERPNDAYQFKKYTLGFFLNMIAIFGLTFPWIYQSLFRTKSQDKFIKALLYLTYGVLIFFFISSFNRRVQTQWIIVISIPLVLLVFNDMLGHENTRKWILRMGILNIAVLLYLRLGLVFEPLFPIHYESHGNKKWVQELKSKVGDMPVIFENSYRLAPMYTFYSGSPSYSLNNINYRQNQYSIDDSEAKVQHQKVFYVSPFLPQESVAFTMLDGEVFYGRYIDDFESFRKLKCDLDQISYSLQSGETYALRVINPYDTDVDISKLKFAVAYMNPNKRIQDIIPIKPKLVLHNKPVLKSNDTTRFTFLLPKPEMERPSYFRIGISENGLLFGLNGNSIKLD